ncbi:MAG: hypothetical protein M1830_006933, partial [Pleopsidium flavum]
ISKPIAAANLEADSYFVRAERQLHPPGKGPHQVVRRRSDPAPNYLWGADAHTLMSPAISQRVRLTPSADWRRSHTFAAQSPEINLKTLTQNTCYDYGTYPMRSRRLSLLLFNPPFKKTL